MRLERYCSFLLLGLTLLLVSCDKRESPIPLPPMGTAQITRVDLGEDYENQVFFDFETGQIVATTPVKAWDLAFEASADGHHVFMNGDRNIYIYKTNSSSISSFTNANALDYISKSNWLYDAACGLPDSTAIGDWRDGSGNSKNEVIIVKFDKGLPEDHIYKKIIIESVSSSEYVLKYGDLSSTTLSTIHIPKNPLYNYTYFSFDDGGKMVVSEPPKQTWDIVFTHYRYVYHDLKGFPYLVSGVLLNPYNTTARIDSTTAFPALVHDASLPAGSYSNHRDIIGFTWKTYSIADMSYAVLKHKNYIIKTRKGQYWKMHFLDFYGPTGTKGSPSFEYERIN